LLRKAGLEGRFGLYSHEYCDRPDLHRAHCGVLLSNRCCIAAERQKRRHRRRFRRHGQPNCLRSPWRSHRALESHNLVRRSVHGDLDHPFDFRCPPHWIKRHRFSAFRCENLYFATRNPGSNSGRARLATGQVGRFSVSGRSDAFQWRASPHVSAAFDLSKISEFF